MKPSGIITLCSDFGSAMGYVAQMKGVILKINPQARLVDVDHNIPARNIACAALTLEHSAPYFSHGSVHLAVVDPGVGSSRRAIIIETDSAYFVGPDNGLFGFIRNSGQLQALYEIDTARIAPAGNSATFHGRDIFAPAAARLSLGEAPQNFAGLCADFPQEMQTPENRETPDSIEGCILCSDTFGNLLTSITHAELDGLRSKHPQTALCLKYKNLEIPLVGTYSDLPQGAFLAYVGSGGQLEIAINGGNARQKSGAAAGDKVLLKTR